MNVETVPVCLMEDIIPLSPSRANTFPFSTIAGYVQGVYIMSKRGVWVR